MQIHGNDSGSDTPGVYPVEESGVGVSPDCPGDPLEVAMRGIRDDLDLLTSAEVAKALDVQTLDASTTAASRDDVSTLIALRVGDGTYRYPAFQLDVKHQRIHPLVLHANRVLRADVDPYGAASWWLKSTDILDGHSPLDELVAGTLTRIAVDNVVSGQRRGM